MYKKNFLLIVLLSLILTGCAGCPDCGSIVQDHRITQKFNAATIEPNYRYYYSGNESEPDAIIGVKKEYSLEGGYWHEVELTEKKLKWWVTSIESSRGLYHEEYNGYEVKTPGGEVTGVYYSRMEWVIIRYPRENVIYVSEPEFFPWQSPNGDDFGRPRPN